LRSQFVYHHYDPIKTETKSKKQKLPYEKLVRQLAKAIRPATQIIEFSSEVLRRVKIERRPITIRRTRTFDLKLCLFNAIFAEFEDDSPKTNK
jgi:hypothetical protein